MKKEAIELIEKLLPYIYPYSGSGMLANWYEHDVALRNAKQVFNIMKSGYGPDFIESVNAITVTDIWTEEQLKQH